VQKAGPIVVTLALGYPWAVKELKTREDTRAVRLSGHEIARRLREEARAEAAEISRQADPPRLRVFLTGEDPASEAYVAAKTRAAEEAGIFAETVRLAGDSGGDALLAAISEANRDPKVDGVLVQLPLPARELERRVFDALDPQKDVDGFHPENVGLLHQGRPRFVPCTPAGVLALLDAHQISLAGRRAVVVGRSNIVGKPLAALLTCRDATVTLCHSRSLGLPEICREADVLVVAIGRPGQVTAEWVREGAVVVDVGIHRFERIEDIPENLRASPRLRSALEEKGSVFVGDVDYDTVAKVAGALTPVPGGVGPLTVAMLLKNTVLAAKRRRRLA